MTSLQLMMQLVVFSTIALGTVYFLFYRPTVDAQRRARRVIAELQVGDEVVTTSGFFGRVVDVTEPDAGPAVVSLDLGGFVVRARVNAVAEIVRTTTTESRGAAPESRTAEITSRQPIAAEGGPLQPHAQ